LILVRRRIFNQDTLAGNKVKISRKHYL
jgi:hypothetical protein